MIPLGSRKQLCINEKVRAAAKSGGDERLNEACLDMQKSGEFERGCGPDWSGKARCEYLPSKSDNGAMVDARDAVLVRHVFTRSVI